MAVRITARAFSHLERIFEFVAERDPAKALLTVQHIREAVVILERHPLMGHKVKDAVASW